MKQWELRGITVTADRQADGPVDAMDPLRILVNRELANLERLITVLPDCLKPGGVAQRAVEEAGNSTSQQIENVRCALQARVRIFYGAAKIVATKLTPTPSQLRSRNHNLLSINATFFWHTSCHPYQVGWFGEL